MGRTSILMVMGFNIIFLFIGNNLRSISSQAYKNYSNYYLVEQARFITESASNLAAGQLSADTNYSPSSSTISFWGGSYKILKTYRTIDRISYVEFKIPAYYGGVYDTTIILESKVRFSEYAIYSNVENGIYWKDGEVCNGPVYTNDKLYIDGRPIFNGPVTSIGGWTGDAGSNPVFNGGYLRGPAVNLPADLGSIKAAATAGGKKYTVETFVEFLSDGRVIVRTGSYGGTQVAGSPFASPEALAPNGALVVEGKNLHIKGVLKGRISACSVKSGGSGGNVIIDSSVTYNTPPRKPDGSINELCDDMLGIIADVDVRISNPITNAHADGGHDHDVTINGSIFARTGGLTADDYESREKGVLRIVGGIQQDDRRGVGTFNSSTGEQKTGFSKNYTYDERLQSQTPPSYPQGQRYRVFSWYDKVHWDKGLWD